MRVPPPRSDPSRSLALPHLSARAATPSPSARAPAECTASPRTDVVRSAGCRALAAMACTRPPGGAQPTQGAAPATHAPHAPRPPSLRLPRSAPRRPARPRPSARALVECTTSPRADVVHSTRRRPLAAPAGPQPHARLGRRRAGAPSATRNALTAQRDPVPVIPLSECTGARRVHGVAAHGRRALGAMSCTRRPGGAQRRNPGEAHRRNPGGAQGHTGHRGHPGHRGRQ